jgi:LmbE family N-acetylglucosaminyl deacetylase
VFAHPDDAEVACGGTIASWVRRGARVHIAVVNAGDKGSSAAGDDPVRLAERRRCELEAAAAVLGVPDVHHLGRPDGESENDIRLREDLVRLVRDVKPEVVLCPDPSALFFGDTYVNHRDHRVCGLAVLDAVAPAAASPLYFPLAGPPHAVARLYLSGTLDADTAVDITDVVDIKAKALACHESQVGGAGEWVHDLVAERAEEAGRLAGVRHAETFRMVRLL